MTIGDKVVDPYSFDGIGTVVALRRADARIASGAMRQRGGLWCQVRFERGLPRWVAADELEIVA